MVSGIGQKQGAVIVFDEDLIKESLEDFVEDSVEMVKDATKPAVKDAVQKVLPLAKAQLRTCLKAAVDSYVSPALKSMTDAAIDKATDASEAGAVTITPYLIDEGCEKAAGVAKAALKKSVSGSPSAISFVVNYVCSWIY